LPPHRHEGTQIGLVGAGTLTYHVLTGRVPVYRAGGDGGPVLARTLAAGEVGQVAAGEWLVEGPDVHHWGANAGAAPLVIYTASLLRAGAPLATPDPP
jgi:quercetin dioxygenase-like cupin family protein